MMKIADQSFEIESSQFLAYISLGQDGWRVNWDIELQAKEKAVNGMGWRPYLNSHSFLPNFPEIENLPGSALYFDDCNEDQEPIFLLYVFEHEALREVSLQFGGWEGREINLVLSGLANLHFGDTYNEDLLVEASLKLPFDGVVVDEGKFEKAVERFSKFFDPEKFEPPTSRGAGRGYIFRAANI